MILSVVAAIFFWFIVVINVSPEYKRTIMYVPITVNDQTASLTSLGLHVVDKSTAVVSVDVTGPRNIIGSLNPDDFNVTPNLSDVSKTGNYSLELTAALKSPDNRIRITKINPNYITVHFDTRLIKTLPVEVKIQNYKVPSGYLMKTPQANPSQITISGPTSELSQVTKAVVNISINQGTTQTTESKGNVELLGADGSSLSLSHIQLSGSSIDVTVPILKTASVPLSIGFSNVPAGFDISNIQYSLDPSSITIAGNSDKISALNEISLSDIDFSKLDINNVISVDIPALDGFMNVENITKVNVSVQLKNTDSRIMSTTKFSVINVPAGYKVINRTRQISQIKLFGPASDIGNVSNITAVIDMSNMSGGTGQFEVPVSFSVPGKSGYWVTGNYSAVIYIYKY
jgi:YbbR domain-containing protein